MFMCIHVYYTDINPIIDTPEPSSSHFQHSFDVDNTLTSPVIFSSTLRQFWLKDSASISCFLV